MNTPFQNHRERIRIAVNIGFVAILLFSKCYAATIDYSVKESGNLIIQTANVAANKVYVKGAGGDPNSDVLFDADREILFVIDHRKRSYLQIDNNTINQVTALSKAVSDTFGSDNETILPTSMKLIRSPIARTIIQAVTLSTRLPRLKASGLMMNL